MEQQVSYERVPGVYKMLDRLTEQAEKSLSQNYVPLILTDGQINRIIKNVINLCINELCKNIKDVRQESLADFETKCIESLNQKIVDCISNELTRQPLPTRY